MPTKTTPMMAPMEPNMAVWRVIEKKNLYPSALFGPKCIVGSETLRFHDNFRGCCRSWKTNCSQEELKRICHHINRPKSGFSSDQ